MKKLFVTVCVLCGINAFGQSKNENAVPVIKAVGNKASYAIGNDWRIGSWTISPHIERDSVIVGCYGPTETFAFKTDRDSVRYTMRPGETRSFIVNLNDTARALTVAYAVDRRQPIHHTNKGNESDSIRSWYGYEPGAYFDKLENLYPTKQLLKSSNNDLENIAALLEWTHNQWKHNGNFSPKNDDALSILNEAKEGGQFPCFAFSIVLANKLNAAGYKSRVLYLKAKTVETDKSAPGHVVTETYVPSLKKWIFLDGQFNAMPMLDGVPLNAAEFQRAIADHSQEIVFYNKVNYNSYPYTNRNYYDFVYPTLYFFDYHFNSHINAAGQRTYTKIGGKTNLMLVPTDGTPPTKFGSMDRKIDYCIYTTNESLFYKAAD